MQRRLARAVVMAAARGLAIDGNEGGFVGSLGAELVGEDLRKVRRLDPVHQDRQPASAWHTVMTGQIAPQKRKMLLAHSEIKLYSLQLQIVSQTTKEQHLPQRMDDPPRLTDVLDRAKMIKQRLQTHVSNPTTKSNPIFAIALLPNYSREWDRLSSTAKPR
ncbi:hypothetical protein [Pararhizobium capsulatum]|nr:hypothetical protein [Pararhizobium capsulatum]